MGDRVEELTLVRLDAVEARTDPPGQGRTGAVDGLYLPTVDPERRRLADSCIADVTGADLPGPKNQEKAVLQSVLAALPRSPRQPGDGPQHGLVHDDTALEPLRRFLLRLTDEPEVEDGASSRATQAAARPCDLLESGSSEQHESCTSPLWTCSSGQSQSVSSSSRE